jgi:glutamate 5-kinase
VTALHQFQFRPDLPKVKTIVVKVGSRILAAGEASHFEKRIANLVEDIAILHAQGLHVILVSSGAIAHGIKTLGLKKKPSDMPLKQACASVGQIQLMHRYEQLFATHKLFCGQVLLTWDDLRDKMRYLNLRNTLFALLEHDAIPVINENDSVGIDEIRFGDNDTLGGQVAMLTGAELFINLTDINGLYTANPRNNKNAQQIPLVESLTPSVLKLADSEGSEFGTGGMVTKLRAAASVTKAGISAIIGDGYNHRLLEVLKEPSLGTLFLPAAKRMTSLHRWIAFTQKSAGSISVDAGAYKAMSEKGKSLLPAGITGIKGTYSAGSTVDIKTPDGIIFARGITNYSSDDTRIIKGRNTRELRELLGDSTFDEVIHRNNLVLVEH